MPTAAALPPPSSAFGITWAFWGSPACDHIAELRGVRRDVSLSRQVGHLVLLGCQRDQGACGSCWWLVAPYRRGHGSRGWGSAGLLRLPTARLGGRERLTAVPQPALVYGLVYRASRTSAAGRKCAPDLLRCAPRRDSNPQPAGSSERSRGIPWRRSLGPYCRRCVVRAGWYSRVVVDSSTAEPVRGAWDAVQGRPLVDTVCGWTSLSAGALLPIAIQPLFGDDPRQFGKFRTYRPAPVGADGRGVPRGVPQIRGSS